METPKITPTSLVSAEARIDNTADTARAHDIAATVSVRPSQPGYTPTLRDGSVTDTATGSVLATFSSYAPDRLNIDFSTADGRTALLADVTAFCAAARSADLSDLLGAVSGSQQEGGEA